MVRTGSVKGLTAVGDCVFVGPFASGTRLTRLTGSLWNSGVTDGFRMSVGVYSLPTVFSALGGGEFPFFRCPGSGQVEQLIGGAPSILVPSNVALDMALDYVMVQDGYVGIGVFDGASDQLCLFSVFSEREVVDEVAVSRPGTAKQPSASGKLAKGPRVVNRSSAPMPVQSGGKPSPQPLPPYRV